MIARQLKILLYKVLALSMVLAGFALAQSDDQTVDIRIPNYIGLKIINGSGNIALNSSVAFDYTADVNSYVAAVEGAGVLEPNVASDFEDIQVVVRRGRWYVFVRATPFSYTGPESGAGLNLSDIRVNRGLKSGLTPDAITARAGGWIRPSWSLSNNWQLIVSDRRSTLGWKSLGFNALDYSVAVQGDEDPGEYVTVVTYFLFNP